jgi:hypothetical protein
LDWRLLHTNGTLALPTKMVFWDELQNPSAKIELGEIAWVTLVAIGLAIVLATLSNFKVHYRIARWCRVSKKSGEIDVWAYVMNSRAPDTTFVTLRDIEQDLAYDGWIHLFSEDCSTTELLLRDVVVYRNSTSEGLYQVGAMYFKLDPKRIILEFRGVQITAQYKYERPITPEPPPSAPSQRGNTEERRGQSDTNGPATPATSSTTPGPTIAAASTSTAP